jgi:hypothetical protein
MIERREKYSFLFVFEEPLTVFNIDIKSQKK